MGAVFCCLRGADDRDDDCCACWPFSFPVSSQSTRQRTESRVTPEQLSAAASASAQPQAPTLDEFRSPPRPLPFDDPRFSQHLHHKHGCNASQCKASSPSAKLELSRSIKGVLAEKVISMEHQGSSLKDSDVALDVAKDSDVATELEDEICSSSSDEICSSEDEEDDCPICLEEYSLENPRKVLQCNHQFHYSCILEWMDRSEACPVCAKIMLFNEDGE